jgi:hypothetical protein
MDYIIPVIRYRMLGTRGFARGLRATPEKDSLYTFLPLTLVVRERLGSGLPLRGFPEFTSFST